MEIRYQYFEEHHLLVQKLTGKFCIDDYARYAEVLVAKDFWPLVKCVLTDVTEIDPADITNHFNRIAEIREKVFKRHYLNVFLVDKPLVTASAHLYQQVLKKDSFAYQYCSTLEQALAYLELDFLEDQMQNVIDCLSQQIEL
ncbi:hypothetical protein E9993_16470 [Labilibacter sediminis]|nr:hypothetical protein E9993_16470 [Labilibacter sediminis]